MKQFRVGAWIVVLAASWAGAQVAQQGDKLVGSGAVGVAWQGGSVALSADGNTAIVGGAADNNGTGAAWVFTRSGAVWTQQGEKLVGTGAVGQAYQGRSVALSADGNTAILGGERDNDGLGAAWVFTRSGGVWTQQGGKLVGSGSVARALQGVSFALSADGNTALVGAPEDHGWGHGVGEAWVFTRSGGAWTQQGGRLVGTDAVGNSAQGYSVALSADGNTALVGGYDDNNGTGAVWVFTRSGGAWVQQGGKLVGSGAVGGGVQGISVGLSADGNTAVVGGSWDDDGRGAAWVFTRSGGVWAEQGAKLVGAGALPGEFYPFGGDIAVAVSGDGNTAAIGRAEHDATGSVWLFTRSAGVWAQQGESFAGNGAVGSAYQGGSVALSGDGSTVLVGGYGDNEGGGATWVFSRKGPALWVPVTVNTAGLNGSHWQSDVGLLNTGSQEADIEFVFHGPNGPVTNTSHVPAGAQSVVTDVVGQLGAGGQGALEISSDQPLRVTSRTYHQASADDACAPSGTKGQSYPILAAGEGLSEGQTAWLPHLVENAAYRTNIGVVNSGADSVDVTVELHDGAGGLLATYAVTLAPGQWKQETQPFRKKAGQTAMDRGYAKVTATSGSGVSAFASVVDNLTNDPTTVAMQR